MLLIKTIIKFSSVIGDHQPDFSTNETVYASCMSLDNVIGQLTLKLPRVTKPEFLLTISIQYQADK